ncbi:MAG: hypothetical protein M3285_12060 [Actinomycetota bacterium]|nr:hypothetical protein [Actinomycetota bacterium]
MRPLFANDFARDLDVERRRGACRDRFARAVRAAPRRRVRRTLGFGLVTLGLRLIGAAPE